MGATGREAEERGAGLSAKEAGGKGSGTVKWRKVSSGQVSDCTIPEASIT